MKDFLLEFDDEDGSHHLKMQMSSYGDKKNTKNLSNRGAQRILKDEKKLLIYQMQDEDFEMDCLDLDELEDFHHYFAACNP